VNPNANGRRWARFWLIAALLVSVVANVTHTVLATSDVTLYLRVPGAIVWPLFTFAGIEILVRMEWESRFSHYLARSVLLAAAVPAAITSYEHQYNLLGLMGERQLIQLIGPAAIDGLMIGCTMALLFTRSLPASAPSPLLEQPREMSNAELEQIVERWSKELEQPAPTAEELERAERMTASEQLEQPKAERAPRAGKPEQEKAVNMMLLGQRQEAVEAGLMGDSTMRRYEKVARLLRHNPNEEIDAKREKVQSTLVDLIRAHANLERAR
jgi:hypothetical protein